jgi:hypothetical protein
MPIESGWRHSRVLVPGVHAARQERSLIFLYSLEPSRRIGGHKRAQKMRQAEVSYLEHPPLVLIVSHTLYLSISR